MRSPLALRTTALLATALLATALAGCVAENAPPAAGDPADQTGAEPGSAEQQEAERPTPPLEQFLAEVGGYAGTPQQIEERNEQRHIQMQEQLASCMTAEGFEYTPEPYPARAGEAGATVDGVTDADRNDRDWVARYGYGIVETPLRPMGQAIDTIMGQAEEEAKEAAEAARAATPNDAYLSGLSESQRQAYDAAMFGTEPAADDPEQDLSEQGCWGQATLDTRGPMLEDMPEHQPFFEAAYDFYNGWQSWPGMGELHAEWADCMTSNGHPGLATGSDAEQSIAREHTALWDTANPGLADAAETMRGEEQPQMNVPPMNALEELAQRERELALADLDCREQIDYWTKYDAIVIREEQRFLDDHKSAVDAVRAAFEQYSR